MRILEKYPILVLLIGVLVACQHEENEPKPQKDANYCLKENFKDAIEIETAVMRKVKEGIHLTASVESSPDNVIQFVSLIDGIISKVHFSLGEQVSKGQLLAELNSAELSSLKSKLKNLNAAIKVAEKKLQSVQLMYEDGIAAQKDLLKAQSELEIYQSKKEKVSANLKLFSASEKKGVFKIKAPSSGIITKKSIAAGTQISADSDPLFTISDLSEVWVMADIYASNVQHVKEGMELNMTTISYPDTIFKGKINAISQVLDKDSKVLKARIVLPNPKLKLKPGMLVDAIAVKNQDIEAVSLPTSAMIFDDNQNFVVVYHDDCDLEIRKIKLLSKSNGTTYIAQGLSAGEKIISKNQLLVYEQIKN